MNNVRSMANDALIGPRFDGKRPGFTGSEYYGAPHPVVRFMGPSNDYKNEFNKSESYKIRLSNKGTSAENQIIAITPGGESTAANIVVPSGVTIAAIIGDGNEDKQIITTSGKEVTCEGSPASVSRFLRYVERNPLRIIGMQMRVDDAEQLQESITVVKHNITRTPAASTINPADHLKASDSNEKLVEFGINHLQFDDQTTVYFTLLANVTVTITLFLGATVNPAALLAVDAKKAYSQLGINNERQ